MLPFSLAWLLVSCAREVGVRRGGDWRRVATCVHCWCSCNIVHCNNVLFRGSCRKNLNPATRDIAAGSFLELMQWFRTVICQDAPLLQKLYPCHPVWQDIIFDTAEFMSWENHFFARLPAIESQPMPKGHLTVCANGSFMLVAWLSIMRHDAHLHVCTHTHVHVAHVCFGRRRRMLVPLCATAWPMP